QRELNRIQLRSVSTGAAPFHLATGDVGLYPRTLYLGVAMVRPAPRRARRAFTLIELLVVRAVHAPVTRTRVDCMSHTIVATTARIHSERGARRHRHHCHPDRPSAARRPEGP